MGLRVEGFGGGARFGWGMGKVVDWVEEPGWWN